MRKYPPMRREEFEGDDAAYQKYLQEWRRKIIASNNRLVPVENEVQDTQSEAWQRLCEYVELVAKEEREKFVPFEALGKDLYAQIFTLPKSIATLKSVKKVWLYGSKLKRIPPEIGEMESLEEFDPYTSYNLHWYPFEIFYCQKLIESRMSTRILYGNYKNRLYFPDLSSNPVKYQEGRLKCSICKKKLKEGETNQFWITLWLGTDNFPLLANICSTTCEKVLHDLPKPYPYFLQKPHKGGLNLEQPEYHYEDWWDETYKGLTRIEASEKREKMKRNRYKSLEAKNKIINKIQKLWDK